MGEPRRTDSDLSSAAQRTRLAWARTALAFAAIGAAMIKASLPAGLIVLVLAQAIWWLGRIAGVSPDAAGSVRRLRMVAIAIVLVAAAALAIALAGSR